MVAFFSSRIRSYFSNSNGIWANNQGAINFVQNPEFHKYTKYIDTKFYLVQEVIKQGIQSILALISSHSVYGRGRTYKIFFSKVVLTFSSNNGYGLTIESCNEGASMAKKESRYAINCP